MPHALSLKGLSSIFGESSADGVRVGNVYYYFLPLIDQLEKWLNFAVFIFDEILQGERYLLLNQTFCRTAKVFSTTLTRVHNC